MPTIADAIGKYIELRDWCAADDAKHEARQKPVKDAMVQLEGFCHAHLNENNEQSIKTENGTVFFKGWTQVKMADKTMFISWVVDCESAEELEQRIASFFTAAVNKESVEEHLKEHNMLPPGIDIARGVKVQFRKS